MTPKDRRPKLSARPTSPSDTPSASHHHLINAWLTNHPNVRRVFARLQNQVADGTISQEDLILLTKKWSDTIPPRHGIVKNLRDFMQLKLALDSSAFSKKKRRRRRRKNDERPRVS